MSGEGLFVSLLSRIDQRVGGETKGASGFRSFQEDPFGFGMNVLGENFTDDVKTLMDSVRDYPITLAKSANAVGKTHAAGRIAAWFYLVHPASQVYTAAAPPESNLKKLLWGEIGSIVEKHPELFQNHAVTSLHIQRSAQSFLTGVSIPSSGTDAQPDLCVMSGRKHHVA